MLHYIEPSINETAFNCPHCSVLTTQYWYKLCANLMSGEIRKPYIINESTKELFSDDPVMTEYIEQVISSIILIDVNSSSEPCLPVTNLHVSMCYNCKKISVWVRDLLVFPNKKISFTPNVEMPEDVIHDFNEAREIIDVSPRGAAALLRLCIQKLCKHMGEKGKNLDDDIGNLLKKGLNPLVQKSLDIVRVIGNEAVHPGVMDLRDDRETAINLFELVNAIADQMISHPQFVRKMYEKLPEDKRKAIEIRDRKII